MIRSRSLRWPAIFALLASIGVVAPSPASRAEDRVITVRAGVATTVMSSATYNPLTCTYAAVPEARIIQAPDHGTAVVGRGSHAIDKGKCEGKLVISRTVEYRSASGYRGPDRIVLEISGERFINGVGNWGERRTIDIVVK